MKNTLKKALSIFLTVLMIVTTVPFAFAAEENEVTHQPSSGEPFVALKNSEGLTYQWYTVGYEEEEITDQNTSIADWGWTKSSYDSETGWIGADIVDHYGGNIFFVISLKANETVRVKLIGDFYDEISLFDEQTYNETAKKYVEGVDTYDLTVKYDGNYTLYAYADCDVNEYINNRIIAHRITPVYTPVESETSFTLNNPEFGKEYVCKISDSNGETVLITNKFEYCYAITNQPTIDNLSVGVNYTEGTTYQWYKVNGEIKEITDENAEGDWSEFDVPFAATVYENGKWFADEYEGMQYYFRIDLKAGETINLELSEPVESVTFSREYGSEESVVPENSKKVTYTAKEDGCYWVITEEVIDYITAYIGNPEYIVLEAQNDATLTPSVDGMYICKVVFADGTTEMSDIVDAVVSHICDFSGEWEITDEMHWKKCANENCSIISDKDKHVYTDGKCFCGYECSHESYYNAICQKCGIECLHEIFSEVTNKGSDIFYIASTGGGNYDQQGDKLLDRDADTKWWCMFWGDTQVSVTFGYPRKATIKSYILTVADDADRYPQFNWTAWTIYGTNDLQGEWTIVHSVSDAILPTEGESGAFEVNSESPYMYYKLVVDAVGDGGYTQQMADINIEVEYKDGRECDECGYICLHEGTLVSVPEKAATCIETGWEAYEYCTACDYTTYKEIPVSDHDWSNKDGMCAVCFEGCAHGNVTGATCITPVACDICGADVYDYTNHEGEYRTFWYNDYQHVSQYDCCWVGAVYGDHVYENYTEIKEAACGENALEMARCTCGGAHIREVEGSALKHSFTKYEVTEEAECGKAGEEVAYCDHGCQTTDEREIPALTHKDDNGDYLCDHGCGYEFEKPVEPEQPENLCGDCGKVHKNGLQGFLCLVFKLIKILFESFKA